MKFNQMPSVFPEQTMWGACAGPFSFIITHDPAGYSASVQDQSGLGARATNHLGGGYGAFGSFTDAEAACKAFWRQARN